MLHNKHVRNVLKQKYENLFIIKKNDLIAF